MENGELGFPPLFVLGWEINKTDFSYEGQEAFNSLGSLIGYIRVNVLKWDLQKMSGYLEISNSELIKYEHEEIPIFYPLYIWEALDQVLNPNSKYKALLRWQGLIDGLKQDGPEALRYVQMELFEDQTVELTGNALCNKARQQLAYSLAKLQEDFTTP